MIVRHGFCKLLTKEEFQAARSCFSDVIGLPFMALEGMIEDEFDLPLRIFRNLVISNEFPVRSAVSIASSMLLMYDR